MNPEAINTKSEARSLRIAQLLAHNDALVDRLHEQARLVLQEHMQEIKKLEQSYCVSHTYEDRILSDT